MRGKAKGRRFRRPRTTAGIATIAALALSFLAASAGAQEADPATAVAPGVYIASASDVGSGDLVPLSLPEAKHLVDPSRIVGGTTTTIAEWPWQAAITADSEFFSGDGFDRQLCGGSLVAPTIVVSAAHCFFDVLDGGNDFDDPDLFAAITGRTQLSSSEGQEVEVSNYFWFVDGASQPLYDPVTNEWDVVFVQLASGSSQQTIKVAGPDEGAVWAPGQDAYITGWGTTSFGGSSSDVLREAKIEMIADATCGSPSSYGSDFIAETMVCAGILAGGKDACQGDSGGPLVVPIAGGGYRLVGDTSWGIACALPNLPGVYGRIADDPIRTSLANGIQSVAGVDVLGSGAQPPLPPQPPSDTSAPQAAVSAKKSVKVGRAIKVVVSSDEAATALATGKVIATGGAKSATLGTAAKKKRTKFKLREASKLIAAGETEILKLKQKGGKKRRKLVRLVRRGAKAKAKIKITLTDPAGNSSTEKVVVKLKK